MSEKHAHTEVYPFKHYRKMRKIVRRKKADVEESAENSFNIDSINEISQDEIVQTDSDEDDTETDGFFLQPVSTKLRRKLLKVSGIKKLDTFEREECKELRGSREQCGCDCQFECLPETCLCALNGIQCQVDRFSFPCGCSRDGCANPSGRIEFNPGKVHNHYLHTMMRLKNEGETEQPESNFPVAGDRGYNSAKRAQHIRFLDDDRAVEGETSFNSTDTGCCWECSVHTANLPKGDTAHSLQLSAYSTSHLNKFDNQFPTFGTSAFDGNGVVAVDSPLMIGNASNCHHSGSSLEPLSGLLNPILNTVDSLDMYSLAHLQHSSAAMPSSATISNNQSYSEDVASAAGEWQKLSHESLLTTSSLIPMVDEDCTTSSSTSSSGSSAASSDQPSSEEQSYHELRVPMHIQNSLPVSLQFGIEDQSSCAREVEKSQGVSSLSLAQPALPAESTL